MNGTLAEVYKNLLARALTDDDLIALLVGEQPYLIESHSGEEGPQDVCQAIEHCLLPCWQSGRFPYLPRRFADTLLKILATYPDHNRAIYVAQNWIWYYHFCLSKKRVNPQGSYGDLFEVDLGAVAVALKRQFGANEDELIRSTRWAGATWDNSNDLQSSLLRTSATARDKLDEPDFVPDTP